MWPKIITGAMVDSETSSALRRNPRPHHCLSAFFAFGATMCALTTALLLFSGTPLDVLWRFNPEAHAAFQSIGNWSIAIMFVVGWSCSLPRSVCGAAQCGNMDGSDHSDSEHRRRRFQCVVPSRLPNVDRSADRRRHDILSYSTERESCAA
jgi:hypothetical protein